MPKTNSAAQPKGHFKSFWPLMVIFVIAAIAAGFVFMFQFNLETDYDLQSLVLTVHRRTEQHMAPVKPAPKKTAMPVTQPTTTK